MKSPDRSDTGYDAALFDKALCWANVGHVGTHVVSAETRVENGITRALCLLSMFDRTRWTA